MNKKITAIALISIAVFFAIYCFKNKEQVKQWLRTYFAPTIIEEFTEPLGLGVCNLDA